MPVAGLDVYRVSPVHTQDSIILLKPGPCRVRIRFVIGEFLCCDGSDAAREYAHAGVGQESAAADSDGELHRLPKRVRLESGLGWVNIRGIAFIAFQIVRFIPIGVSLLLSRCDCGAQHVTRKDRNKSIRL